MLGFLINGLNHGWLGGRNGLHREKTFGQDGLPRVETLGCFKAVPERGLITIYSFIKPSQCIIRGMRMDGNAKRFSLLLGAE